MTLMTVKEVALHLNASPRFVLDELRRKNLRGSRLGATRAGWRIDSDDLDNYVDAKANVAKVRRSA